MKTLALIARRPDHDRDAFRRHYEEIHAPLAMQTILQGTSSYVRHHLREEIHGDPFFDVVTAFVYRDAAAARALFERSQGADGERIRADELSFMDKARNTFFVVTQRRVSGEPDRSKQLQALALVRRADSVPAAAFHDDYERRGLPALLDAVSGAAWCLQNVAHSGEAVRPAFDCVTQIHADSGDGLLAWAAEVESAGHEVVVARVSEHETITPW